MRKLATRALDTSFWQKFNVCYDSGDLHVQIARRLRIGLQSGALAAGSRLPSQPDLARHLGIGRESVKLAYEILKREGRLVTPGRTLAVGSHSSNGTRSDGSRSHDRCYDLPLDRSRSDLSPQIVKGIRRMIFERTLRPNALLPNVGTLTNGLRIAHLQTVIYAYDELEAGGFLYREGNVRNRKVRVRPRACWFPTLVKEETPFFARLVDLGLDRQRLAALAFPNGHGQKDAEPTAPLTPSAAAIIAEVVRRAPQNSELLRTEVIEAGFRTVIAAGFMPAGTRLPHIRDVAAAFHTYNHAVSGAYQQLEDLVERHNHLFVRGRGISTEQLRALGLPLPRRRVPQKELMGSLLTGFERLIISGQLPPKSFLPSAYQLAGEVPICRTVIWRIYALLAEEGFVEKVGKGRWQTHIIAAPHRWSSHFSDALTQRRRGLRLEGMPEPLIDGVFRAALTAV